MNDLVYEDWIVVFKSGTDYEADIVRDRLDDAGVSAVVLTQRDHAFNLTQGELAQVRVLVPPGQAEDAKAILASAPISDEELEAAAMAGRDPGLPKAETETIEDSGDEYIHLSVPPSDDEEEPS